MQAILSWFFALLLLVVKGSDPIHVHLVPHSHCDVGWLKTVDQYYVGANNSIQNANVHLILDTVVEQLQLNSSRRFIWVEQAFFYRWWTEQTDKTKNIVRQLVRNGKFEFINGGWAMHDEGSRLLQCRFAIY